MPASAPFDAPDDDPGPGGPETPADVEPELYDPDDDERPDPFPAGMGEITRAVGYPTEWGRHQILASSTEWIESAPEDVVEVGP